MKLPFLPAAKDVLIKPEDFFDKEIQKIKRWQQPVMYLLFFIIIASFFMSGQVKQFFVQLTDIAVKTFGVEEFALHFTPSALGIAALFLLLVFVLLLATSFKYWVAHWYIKIWNKEATFKHTYAVLTYGGTPGWLAMPFSMLSLYFLAQATIGDGHVANWLLAILSGTLWLGLEGYSIYLRVYALARIQKIERWQAVLSVYVFGLLTYLVGVVIIEFIIITVVLLILVAIGAMPI